MIAYLTILATTMAGYGNMPVWIILISMFALSALSVLANRRLYSHLTRLGYMGREMAASTLAMSLLNSLAASAGAYVVGAVIAMTS